MLFSVSLFEIAFCTVSRPRVAHAHVFGERRAESICQRGLVANRDDAHTVSTFPCTLKSSSGRSSSRPFNWRSLPDSTTVGGDIHGFSKLLPDFHLVDLLYHITNSTGHGDTSAVFCFSRLPALCHGRLLGQCPGLTKA